jgi:hypothetical protein
VCLQFKDHLKKAEAVSEFAKNKTIAEQRRFLPVYGVREEMLQVGKACEGPHRRQGGQQA